MHGSRMIVYLLRSSLGPGGDMIGRVLLPFVTVWA
jgi:hypothetical protein